MSTDEKDLAKAAIEPLVKPIADLVDKLARMVPKHDRPIPRKTNALRAGARSASICGLSLLESAGRRRECATYRYLDRRGETERTGALRRNRQIRVS